MEDVGGLDIDEEAGVIVTVSTKLEAPSGSMKAQKSAASLGLP